MYACEIRKKQFSCAIIHSLPQTRFSYGYNSQLHNHNHGADSNHLLWLYSNAVCGETCLNSRRQHFSSHASYGIMNVVSTPYSRALNDTLGEILILAYAKTKTQISCEVTAQLISASVFALWIAVKSEI